MLEKTGIVSQEQVMEIAPSAERRARGPVAVVECFQNIPCNPCYTSCRFGAMKELTDINDTPEVFYDKCTGCGACISKCPGLAICVIDESYSETEAIIRLPYEFLPLPEENQYVTATDRAGQPVCRAKVYKVQNTPAQDRTPIVWLVIPKDLTMTVRSFKIGGPLDDNTFVCRCEGLTLGELREYIRQGYTTLDEIKRLSRAGMGPCQGRTCRELIMREIAAATGTPPAEQRMSTFRPPVKPIRLEFLLGGEEHE